MKTPIRVAAALAALTFALLPKVASAQAICSAPHSSPTLAQSGALRTLEPGAGWVQLSLYRQISTDFFAHTGDRQPFLADAEFETRSVFLTAAVGVVEGLEVWAQVPTHNLGVESDGGDNASTGLGDLRLAVRAGPELFGIYDVPIAVRAGFKVPGSDFPVDATVLPLTEGQQDYELSVESGGALPGLPLYAMGWVGFRWRGENAKADRNPGDERFAHLAFGGLLGSVSLELAADALWGTPPFVQGLRLEAEARRLFQLLPTVGVGLGPGRLELTGQFPVSGRNLPGGRALSLGYRTVWGL